MSHDESITAAAPVKVDQLEVDQKGKGDVLMLEELDRNAPGQDLKIDHVPQSDTANLTQRQAYRKFWKVGPYMDVRVNTLDPIQATLFCFMVSFGAMMDGYHGSIDGNLVANQGFVKQIG